MKRKLTHFFLIATLIIVVLSVCFPLYINVARADVFSSVMNAGANAYAGTTPSSCSVFSFATCLVYFFSYVIADFAGFFIAFAIWLVQLGLQFNQQIFSSPLVQTGFGISLAIANLGFVLGIIVIAIATILHQSGYGVKQILWKLVVMAILVNFGLVITAPIMGFAQSLSNTFLQGMTGGNSSLNSSISSGAVGFANTLTADFSPQNLLQPPATPATGDVSGNSFMQAVVTLIFAAVISFLIIIALLALAGLLLVRYVEIGILLILLPFAWLAWVFPRFSNYFSKWWDKFIEWALFPAVALFFIYLAVMTAGQGLGAQAYQQSVGISQTQIQSPTNCPSTGCPADALGKVIPNNTTNNQPSILQTVADDILLCALMIGGLIAASSMAGTAGKTVVGALKSASTEAKKRMVKKSKEKASSAGREIGNRIRAGGKQYNPATRETTTRFQRWGSKLQNVPGLRGAGATLARTASPETIKKSNEKPVQDYVDNDLKSLTNDGVKARAKSIKPKSLAESAALAQELARRDLTTDTDIAPLMDKYIAAADKAGNLEKVTNNRPDLMPTREVIDPVTKLKRSETRAEATARAVKSAKGDIIQSNAEIFDYADQTKAIARLGIPASEAEGMLRSAVLSLNSGQLTALGSDVGPGSQDRKNNITNSIKKLIADNPNLKKEILRKEADRDPVTNKLTGGFSMVPTGQYEINDAEVTKLAATKPEYKNLEGIVKHMKASNNWDDVLK